MRSTEGAGLSVLVVDDDSSLLRTLTDILRLHGYQAESATNGKEGLEMAGRSAPVIALVDLRLPDMDGMEVVAQLKANSSETEVVILTGNASVESAVRAFRQQSFDYLIKPVRPDELFRTLERAGDRFHRRHAEAALRQSEEQLQRLFAAVNDGLLITDSAGVVVRANPAASRITGLVQDDLLGRSIASFMQPAEDSPADEPDVGPVHDRRLLCADGSVLRVELETAGFAPDRLVHTLRDVTRQREIEEQLRVAQKLEALGRLAGAVAHDFNNVLTAIRGYADLARDRFADAGLSFELDEIHRAAERASGLTRQLLAFSRRQVMQPRVLDLATVLAGMEGMLRRLVREDIVLQIHAHDNGARVRCDPSQLEQVILNLVVNARDAMPDGGALRIDTGVVDLDDATAERLSPEGARGRFAYLRVSDNGLGIPAEVLERIFEPFFTTKEQGHGTGLGLATVHGIVRQFGGFITVEPRPMGGTSFTVRLPLEEAEAEPDPEPSVAAARPSGGSERILVVEDDPAIRRMIAMQLTRAGYVVMEATDGAEMLDLLARGEKIDLLITDIVLPGMSGWEVGRRAAQARPGISVLYMSGYADHGVADAVIPEDIAFIAKPFYPLALAQRVRAILDGAEGGRPR